LTRNSEELIPALIRSAIILLFIVVFVVIASLFLVNRKSGDPIDKPAQLLTTEDKSHRLRGFHGIFIGSKVTELPTWLKDEGIPLSDGSSFFSGWERPEELPHVRVTVNNGVVRQIRVDYSTFDHESTLSLQEAIKRHSQQFYEPALARLADREEEIDTVFDKSNLIEYRFVAPVSFPSLGSANVSSVEYFEKQFGEKVRLEDISLEQSRSLLGE